MRKGLKLFVILILTFTFIFTGFRLANIVKAAEEQTVTEISVSNIDKTYDGNAVEDAEVTFKSATATEYSLMYKLKDADDSTITSEKPVNAGTYTLYVIFPAVEGYDEYIYTTEFTINKAENTISNFSQTNILCNETPSPTATAINGTVTFTYSDNDSTGFTSNMPSGVGTFYVKATAPASENYNEVSEVKSFTIEHEYEYTSIVWSDNSSAKATYTCKHHSTVTMNLDCTITNKVITVPTCEENGLRRYTASVTYKEVTKTDDKDVPINKKGHDYSKFEKIVWDGLTAKAIYSCKNDAKHEYGYDCTITEEVKTAPTCEGKGLTYYYANFKLNKNDTNHTEYIKVETNPIGHNYVFDKIDWESGTNDQGKHYVYAYGRFVCNHDNCEFAISRDCEVNSNVSLEPTCEADGVRSFSAVCGYNNKNYGDHSYSEVVPKLGHKYEFSKIVWTDKENAVAVFVCANNEEHIDNHNCTITSSVSKAATCELDGLTTYTATYDKYSDDSFTEPITKLGHNEVFTYIEWISGTKAVGHFDCNNEGCEFGHIKNCEINSYVITDPTCTEAGLRGFTALCSEGGHNYSDRSYTEPIEALNHAYEFVEFVWDGYVAKAKHVCSNNNEHEQLRDCEITEEITLAPTCETEGTKVYTATYKTHVDQKTEVLPAINHNPVFATIEWTGYEAKAVYICNNDQNHILKYDCEIEATLVADATCTEDGLKTYKATFKLESEAEAHEVTINEVLTKLGHDYSEEQIVYTENGTVCTVTTYCTHNHDHYLVSVTKIEIVKQTEEKVDKTESYVEELKIIDGKITEDVHIETSKVEEVDEELVSVITNEIGTRQEIGYIMDISLLNSREVKVETGDNSRFSVTISIPEELKGRDSYSIVIINKDGTTEVVEAILDKALDKLTFITKVFNKIAIIAQKNPMASNAFSVMSLTLFVTFTITYTLKFNINEDDDEETKQYKKNIQKKVPLLIFGFYVVLVNVSLLLIVDTNGILLFLLNVLALFLGGALLLSKYRRIKNS